MVIISQWFDFAWDNRYIHWISFSDRHIPLDYYGVRGFYVIDWDFWNIQP